MTLLALTGLQQEAQILREANFPGPILCGSDDRDNLASRVPEGCTAIMVFGCAGGLAAQARIGDVFVARNIMGNDGDMNWLPDAASVAWREDVRGALIGAVPIAAATIYSSQTEQAATPEARRVLYGRTFALAAETESYAVVSATTPLGLPWLVIRAISDTWDSTVTNDPKLINRDGSTNVIEAIEDAVSGHAAEMATEAKGYNAALAALRKVAAVLGPLGWCRG